MTNLSECTWSAIGLLILLACSSSKSAPFNDGNAAASGAASSTGIGGNTGTSIVIGASGTGSNVNVTAGGSDAANTGSSGTGSKPSTGTGSNGSGSASSSTVGGAGGSTLVSSEGGDATYDPPPATGGDGATLDPPKGGSGNTVDPPPGDTIDPPPGDTIDPPPGDTIDPPPGDTIDPPPPPGCTFTEIDKVNVIVFKDANPSGADSEGRMWVGGNLTIAGGYAVNTTSIAGLATTCSDWALVVGGNITGDPLLAAGKAAYGGTFSGTFNGKCGIFHATPVDFAALEAKFDGYSAAFVAYPTQNPSVLGTVTIANGVQIVLTGTNPTLNVFNLTADQLAIGSIKFVVPSTSSVVVNISGKTVRWTGKSFVMPDGGTSCKGNSSDWCHKILYNFYEATSLYMEGIGVQGSVLAPYATVDGTGGNIDGQLVCKYLKGGLEYHPYYFNGCLLLPKA
jgi:choice-of-anchor A domain-containing protein